MQTIFKYRLGRGKIHDLTMPQGSVIISAQNQHDAPTLWAAVDTTQPPVIRRIATYVTGGDMELGTNDEDFLGTIQFNGGSFILHVFDQGEIA